MKIMKSDYTNNAYYWAKFVSSGEWEIIKCIGWYGFLRIDTGKRHSKTSFFEIGEKIVRESIETNS